MSSHLTNKILISGSADENIKYWHTDTGECLKTSFGHTRAVNTLEIVNNILFSGGSDYTIKIWNIGIYKYVE